MSNKIESIEILKVFTIILVVMGHSFPADGYMNIPTSFLFVKRWLYSFHMPLFIFISGFLFAKTNKFIKYQTFIKNKFIRLIAPYFLFILFTTISKGVLSKFAVNPILLNTDLVLKHLLFPSQAVIGNYWFLITLFLIFSLYPIYKNILSFSVTHTIGLTVLLVILNIYNPLLNINILSLNRFFEMLIYFWLGCISVKYYAYFDNIVNNKATFFICFMVLLGLNTLDANPNLLAMAKAMLGVLMSWSLSKILQNYKLPLVDMLKGKTFTIYLVHGVVIFVIGTLLKFSGLGFYVFYFSSLITGIFVPVLILNIIKRCNIKSRVVKVVLGM